MIVVSYFWEFLDNCGSKPLPICSKIYREPDFMHSYPSVKFLLPRMKTPPSIRVTSHFEESTFGLIFLIHYYMDFFFFFFPINSTNIYFINKFIFRFFRTKLFLLFSYYMFTRNLVIPKFKLFSCFSFNNLLIYICYHPGRKKDNI